MTDITFPKSTLEAKDYGELDYGDWFIAVPPEDEDNFIPNLMIKIDEATYWDIKEKKACDTDSDIQVYPLSDISIIVNSWAQ